MCHVSNEDRMKAIATHVEDSLENSYLHRWSDLHSIHANTIRAELLHRLEVSAFLASARTNTSIVLTSVALQSASQSHLSSLVA